MIGRNRQKTTPVPYAHSNRNHAVNVLTSLKPGKCVPVAFIPLLREDQAQGRIRVAVEMMETREILANGVNLRLTAVYVPMLAFDRFQGSRDQFERSWAGEPKDDDVGAAVIPFVETHLFGAHGSNEVYKAVGLHGQPTHLVSTSYLEAYNQAWNWRARNISEDITQRARLDSTLAKAFWSHTRYAHAVPDFDAAVLEGNVALNVLNQKLALKGLYRGTSSSGNPPAISGGTGTIVGASGQNVVVETAKATVADVYAELTANNIVVSLANIELAKQTRAWAKMREDYDGHDQEFLIEALMSGLHIPEEDERQPWLITEKVVRFSQAKRYATNSDDLSASAVSGVAVADLFLKTPRVETGGVIVVTAEAVPEQLFERAQDPYFHAVDVSKFPDAMADHLDPQKVEILRYLDVDSSHTGSSGTFAYVPKNWRWNNFPARVGGKFLRPTVDAGTDESRMRIWAMEVANPTLSDSFYTVTAPHQKVFLNTEDEPFEAVVAGNVVLNGLTQFGGVLVEATGNYEEVMQQVPQDRIQP